MVAQRNLRVGYTTVLQVAFPALPDDLTNVDVLMATVPPFWHVPVTPRGMLPLASYPADLARPADPAPVIGRTGPFSYRLAGQRYRVMINVIYTSRSFTSIAWTIQSMESAAVCRRRRRHRLPTQRRPVVLTTRSRQQGRRSRWPPTDPSGAHGW